MNPRISIIIPVYNVECYLRESIESVLAQTLKDIEVLCVDDGSTDRSVEILKEYASHDARIRVLQGNHKNAGAARNIGLKQASGDWLFFFDSDDVMSPYALETLVGVAESQSADVVSSRSIAFKDGDAIPHFVEPRAPKTIDATFSQKDTFATPVFEPGPCKLFRRSFVEKFTLTFLEQRTTNDFTFVMSAITLALRFVVVEEDLLALRKRPTSIQGQKSKNRSTDAFLNAVSAYCDNMEKWNVWTDVPWKHSRFCAYYLETVFWELSTFSTAETYRAFYLGMIQFENRLGLVKAFNPQSARERRLFRRYRKIVRRSTMEYMRAWIESCLAPIIGGRHETKGLDRFLMIVTRVLLRLLFEPYDLAVQILHGSRR